MLAIIKRKLDNNEVVTSFIEIIKRQPGRTPLCLSCVTPCVISRVICRVICRVIPLRNTKWISVIGCYDPNTRDVARREKSVKKHGPQGEGF